MSYPYIATSKYSYSKLVINLVYVLLKSSIQSLFIIYIITREYASRYTFQLLS